MACCSNTAAALSCCPDKEYVQDKVCTPWSGTVVDADVEVVVFTNNINQNIVGTGYVLYDVGPDDITLDFLDSTGAVINTMTLTPGTSLAFTYRRFSSIQSHCLMQQQVPIKGSSVLLHVTLFNKIQKVG